MSLQTTPKGDRLQIALYGKRNAGKSSIINAITGQPLAIVSEVKGTTTDPVSKAMEILPLGPCMFIDTPGLDDEGELGRKRVEKAMQVLNKTDIALVVIDISEIKESDLQTERGLPQKELEIIHGPVDLTTVVPVCLYGDFSDFLHVLEEHLAKLRFI